MAHTGLVVGRARELVDLSGVKVDGGRFRRQQHLSAQHYLAGQAHGTAINDAVELVADHLDVPMVQVNVLDDHHQVTIAAVGTPLGPRPLTETLCRQVVSDSAMKTLADIDAIPASAQHIKSYLGIPLTGREGLTIGSLCVLDTVDRSFTPGQVDHLLAAGRIVQDQLELIRRRTAPTDSDGQGSGSEAGALLDAIDQGQIVPFYQPIVDLVTGDIVGVEALARWQHPQRGLVPPDAFIPTAEDSDVIIDLDLAILQRAATQLRRWLVRHPALRLNVNLSARHFHHPDCVDRLGRTVQLADVDPRCVTFEITETAALTAPPADRDFLLELQHAGFTVVLDDFGSGFAAIEKVLRLPINGIKLNRTLTCAMDTRSGSALARHLTALAADLHLTTVLEGIETAAQLATARRLGAEYGQGHLFCPARPAADITTHLETSPAPVADMA